MGVRSRSELKLKSVAGTIFHVERDGALHRIYRLCIDNDGQACAASLRYSTHDASGTVELGTVPIGESVHQVPLPDVRRSTEVALRLSSEHALACKASTQLTPSRHWYVYLVPIAHHDYGYTDTIENVMKSYRKYYEQILGFCRETDGYPEEARFRYTAEQSWSILDFLDNSSAPLRGEMLDRIREGRVEVPALFGNEITNLLGHEELVRLLYPSFVLRRQHGIPVGPAAITDIPGLSWGLATVLAGAGVRHLFAGFPDYFEWGKNKVHNFWDEPRIMPRGRPHAFLWEGPDGSRVLTYYQGSYGIWTPSSLEGLAERLTRVLEDLEKREHPFDALRFAYDGGDNRPPNPRCSLLAKEWNARWSFPKIVVGTNSMFFRHLDQDAKDLPVLRGELPDTDYVVGATSSCRETAINRATHDLLTCAEKFAAVASTMGEEYPVGALREAWRDMLLYDEHTWGMFAPFGPHQDWNWTDKSRHAYRAQALARSILDRALMAISGRIGMSSSEEARIVVFNPLSFPRSDLVVVEDFKIPGSFDLVEAETGEKIPYQVDECANPDGTMPWADSRYAMGHVDQSHSRQLCFVARDVPPMGYRTYRITLSPSEALPGEDAKTAGVTMENRFYRVAAGMGRPGLVTLVDKESGTDLADAGEYSVGEPFVRSVKTGDTHRMEEVVVGRRCVGPVYQSIVVEGSLEGFPKVVQEILLYNQVKRIDFRTRLLKDTIPFLELFFAFPFRLDNASFKFEGTDSVIVPLRDQVPGSNTDYYAVQHWAQVSNHRLGVVLSPIDSHLLMFGGLYAGYLSQAHHGIVPPGFGHPFLEHLPEAGHVYSYAMVSNFRTNFRPTQNGDLLLRYSMTSHVGTSDAVPRVFGWAAHNPLIPVVVKGTEKGILPLSTSFCRLGNQDVVLLAMKRAEDGRGLILRFAETLGTKAEVRVTLPGLGLHQAELTNIVEEDGKLLEAKADSFTLKVGPFGIATVRIMPEERDPGGHQGQGAQSSASGH